MYSFIAIAFVLQYPHTPSKREPYDSETLAEHARQEQ